MKLHFTSDWLRSHIDNDPDIECEAGFPLRDASVLKRFVGQEEAEQKSANNQTLNRISRVEAAPERKSAVLYKLILQIRRRDQLTIAQLADKLRINPDELTRIEDNPGYVPNPRTVYQIARYLKISVKTVEGLTAAGAQNDNVAEAALRFAASSEDLSKLSRSEKKQLNDFVKTLVAIDKGF